MAWVKNLHGSSGSHESLILMYFGGEPKIWRESKILGGSK